MFYAYSKTFATSSYKLFEVSLFYDTKPRETRLAKLSLNGKALPLSGCPLSTFPPNTFVSVCTFDSERPLSEGTLHLPWPEGLSVKENKPGTLWLRNQHRSNPQAPLILTISDSIVHLKFAPLPPRVRQALKKALAAEVPAGVLQQILYALSFPVLESTLFEQQIILDKTSVKMSRDGGEMQDMSLTEMGRQWLSTQTIPAFKIHSPG